ESVLGLGSRFSLLVPATAREPGQTLDPAPPRPLAELARPLEPPAPRDDRDQIGPADSALLVIDSDVKRARTMLELVHGRGDKVVLAADVAAAFELAREHQPRAVLLAGDAKRVELGLAELKSHPDTRHLPVVAIGGRAARLPTLRLGAAAFVERSLDP